MSGAQPLAEHAAAVLLAEAEHEPTGTNWRFVPPRFRTGPAARCLTSRTAWQVSPPPCARRRGADRSDLDAAARSGAEHLVSLGDPNGHGFRRAAVPSPATNDQDEVTYTWCHGATGTSLLFLGLDGQASTRSPASRR